MKALTETNFNFPKQIDFYKGKVRDVYTLGDDLMIMIVTDRISAFDIVLPRGIPYKGQVLNQIASKFLDLTKDIVPNWKIETPDPMVTIGYKCKPFPVEMIVRAYLSGSSWRDYQKGIREISGVKIPNGMKENQAFEKPIITPTTKAEQGEHDQNISKNEIIKSGLISIEDFEKLENYSYKLFERGAEIAKQKGLILVDTKYEFGKRNGDIHLIDEIHTPDSSRYFYLNCYEDNFKNSKNQKQLSKEFVREWLIINGFNGEKNQELPIMDDLITEQISERYIELYENIIGNKFIKQNTNNIKERIYNNITKYLGL